MAEIVNLRMARKAKARVEKDRAAEENRTRHGRSKAEKQRDNALNDKATAFIEGHRRDASTSPLRGGRAEGAGGGSGISAAPTINDRDESSDR